MKNFTKLFLPLFFISVFPLAGWAQAPTVNAPTITSVTTTSATLGGTIATGTGITNYGTSYKTTTGVTQANNPQSGGAVSDASIPYTFTQNRTGLTAGTLYYWKAWATNGTGTGLTSEQTFFTEPSQPGSFSITAVSTTNNQIVLSFPAASTLVSGTATGGYVLFRHAGSAATVSLTDGAAPPANGTGDKIATITAALTTFTDSGLSPQTQYYYTLVPFVWDGSTPTLYNYNTSSPLSTNGFTLSNPPSGQPTSFTSVGGANTQINLTISWGAVTANGFLIYRNAISTPVIAGGDFTNGTTPPAALADGSTLVTSVSLLSTSYNDTGLTAATQYYYILVPFGYDGSNASTYNYLTSSPKTTTSYTLSNPPSGQPTPFNATGAGATQINLSWSSVTANGFLIYRHSGSTSPDVSGIANGAAPPSPLADGSTLVTTAAGGATSYNNTGLSAATQYSYTIVPFGYDNSHAGTYNYLITSAPTASAYTYSSSPSGQPISFTATAAGSTQINLSWSSGVTSIAGFLIYRLPGNTPVSLAGLNSGSAPLATLGDGSTLIATTLAGATLYNDNSLSGSTKYQYRLVPFNYDGSHAGTYNFLTAGAKSASATTFDNTSTITYTPGYSTPSIPYINFQALGGPLDNTVPNCVSLGRFTVTDMGGDGLNTTLASVTISITNNSNVAEIAIFDSSQNNQEQFTTPGSSVTFIGPPIHNISAFDGSTDYFEIWATFKSSVVDQQKILISITGATVIPNSSGISSFAASNPGTTNKIQVNATQLTLTTGSASVNTGANFGPVTVTAVDALSNIQTGRTDAIALSISTGTGTLTTTPAGNQNLVGGSISWSAASINLAGSKIIKAQKTPSTPNPLTFATTSVTVNSAGVTITPGTLTNSPLCYSGQPQAIGPIVIQESDPGDFAVGTNVTFILQLPSGFQFNTSQTTAPTYAGVPGPATDFTAVSALTYPDNQTVSFSYTVATATKIDQLTISGLQVRYTGTSNVTGNLVRTGGSATIAGSIPGDNKSFCAVASQNSATVIDFSVQTVPGQAAVTPNQTRFQVGIASVQLIGNPSGGSFSGPGVSPNATYNYIFSPSSLGVSTGNAVVYTYTETTGQQCQVTKTKSFDVYASVIQNLQLSYCTNATPSTGLTVVQSDIDNQFPPASSYQLYDLVYLAGYSCAGFGCSYGYSSTYIGYASITSVYTYSYNLLGTTTLAHTQVYTYTYNWNGSYYAFAGYTFSSNKIANAGSVTTFDPSYPYYRSYYPNAVLVYYRAIDVATSSIVKLGGGQYVPLINPPSVSFSLPKRKFCANDASVNLVGTPAQNSPVTDKFTVVPSGAGGIPPNSGNTWTFSPNLVTQLGSLFTIRYDYTDPSTLCSNYDTLAVTVYGVPGQVLNSELNGTGTPSTLITCVGNPAVTFKGNAPSTNYNWYSSSVITPANLIQSGLNFTPTTSTASAGSTDYYVTKILYASPTFAGCESTVPTNVRMTVQAGPSLTLATSAVQICSGSLVDIKQTTIGATLTNATIATWSKVPVTGQFVDGSNNPSTSLGSSGAAAVHYVPSGTDLPVNGSGVATTVILTLTTDNLQAPSCLPAQKQITVTINPIPNAPAFTNPASTLVSGGVVEYCDNTIDPKLVVAGAGSGTITFYSDPGLTTTLFSGADPATYFYNFNPATSRSVDIYTTQTISNCQSPSTKLTFLLHPQPTVNFSVANQCFNVLTNQQPTAAQFTPIISYSPTSYGAPSTPYTTTVYDWTFGDGTANSPSAAPSHGYKQLGFYATQLTATSNKGCTQTSAIQQIEIGPVPQTDFTVTKQCFGDSTAFLYTAGLVIDNSSPGRTIQTWAWDFGDPPGVSTSALSDPKHKYLTLGAFSTSLMLTTKLGCSSAQSKPVYVLPLITFNSSYTSYAESFENNNNVPLNNSATNFGAWAPEVFITNTKSATSTSWNLQTPAGSVITSASDGSKAWVAGLLGTANNGLNSTYNTNEISVLNSPCFDISGLTKPVIAFDYLADTWTKDDGTYLQYSADGGSTWNTLGQKGKGLNWYNDNNIIALASINPNLGQATGQEGWDAPGVASNSWATSRYSLSGKQVGATPLRFRFYFGSQANIDPTTKPGDPNQIRLPYNGFGLDNFAIQNANRTVLAEYFTNQTAASQEKPIPSASDNNFLAFQSTVNLQSLIKMQYQTSIGGPDSINALNPQDNMARAAFYGVTGGVSASIIPFRGFLDGFTGPSTFNGRILSGPPALPSAVDNYFDARILVTSPLSISVATATSTNSKKDSLLLDATITVLNKPLPLNGHQYVVQTAIVKDVSGTGAGPYIMRKMLPNATGTPLTAMAANTVQKIHYSFTESKPYDTTNLYAITFVQDLVAVQPPSLLAGAQEILQATIQRVRVNALGLITEVSPLLSENVRIYPNPADREFTIVLPQAASQSMPVMLANQLGQLINVGAFGEGEQSKNISTQGLAEGVYILQLGGSGSAVRQKVVVLHK
ncbi:MAG: T9SS type A sorting domain-containing protein [Bacteroidetes bacterium]|nr:T9SS type A sorting domain-containing protein [Bacteroidota bacterium]